MLKCGQKDNKKYTFGIRKDQLEDVEGVCFAKLYCCKCGESLPEKSSYCPKCGEKI